VNNNIEQSMMSFGTGKVYVNGHLIESNKICIKNIYNLEQKNKELVTSYPYDKGISPGYDINVWVVGENVG
jgi:hypothetical protein